ncbi:MAG: hypothetical protein QF496_02545 [Dehalococcoidia bacterium]|jgi:uncharacterized membrane protein|nr:hypothetical protein [Dehalococcoidia bacterium]
MKKLFITTLIFVFTFFQQGHISADDITISISGSIENKTKNSDSSKEYLIKLFKLINNSEEINEISTTNTIKAKFSFPKITIDETEKLFLVTENDGLSVITELQPNEKWDDLNIEIYDRGTNLDYIKITEYSLMIPQTNSIDGKMSILGLITLENSGDKTFQADLSKPDLSGFDLLRFSLPEGFSDLNVDSDLPPGNVMEIPTGFALSNPVPPGIHQIIFSYSSLTINSIFSFNLKLPFGADKVRVLMNAPEGIIKGEGLKSLEKIKIDEDFYTISEGTNYDRGSNIELELSSFAESKNISSIFTFFETNLYKIILIFFISLILLLLIIYSVFLSMKNNPDYKLSEERERLILKIDELKKSLQSGKISKEEYTILEKGFREKLKQIKGEY